MCTAPPLYLYTNFLCNFVMHRGAALKGVGIKALNAAKRILNLFIVVEMSEKHQVREPNGTL